MTRRAWPAFLVIVVAFAAVVAVARESPEPQEAFFTTPAGAWMPSVSEQGALTGSWFCPGVPASAEAGVGGEVVIANRDDDQLVGHFSILTADGLAHSDTVTVAPWSRSIIDVDAYVNTQFASVIVEIDGGRGFVEQQAFHPAGNSVAPCSNATSSEWYLADGFTVDGSVETLILTNPYDDPVSVDLTFATESGESRPAAFTGFTIAPQTVDTIPIAELGARDEPVIAVKIESRFGRLVVGRAQHYTGGGRLGYGVVLAAPALRDQFWFADGEAGPGITETFAVYNPTEDDVEVDVVFLGLPLDAGFTDLPPIEVPSREVVVFDPSAIGDVGALPVGRHSVVFSTLAEPSIVVERVLTRPAGELVATTVVLGAPPRIDGYVATRWHIGIGPSVSAEEALVVYNVDNVEGQISIQAVGPAGPTPVESLAEVTIAPGAVRTIDLTDPDVIGHELIIDTTNRVFVERLLPRGGDLAGRSGSWALPSGD